MFSSSIYMHFILKLMSVVVHIYIVQMVFILVMICVACIKCVFGWVCLMNSQVSLKDGFSLHNFRLIPSV